MDICVPSPLLVVSWVPSAAVSKENGLYRISVDRVIEADRKCGGFYLEELKEWSKCINAFANNEVMFE